MKDIALLVWLTQLGLSVAAPPAGFILLALGIQGRFQLGDWVIWVAVVFGMAGAVDGLRSSLRTLERISKRKKREKDKGKDVLSFNDHD